MDINTRTSDLLLFDGVNLLDIAGPTQVFHQASYFGEIDFKVRPVSLTVESVTTSCGIEMAVHYRLSSNSKATDILVPGGPGVNAMLGRPGLQKLIAGWQGRRPEGRVISICSGALVVADSGALIGEVDRSIIMRAMSSAT